MTGRDVAMRHFPLFHVPSKWTEIAALAHNDFKMPVDQRPLPSIFRGALLDSVPDSMGFLTQPFLLSTDLCLLNRAREVFTVNTAF